MQGYEVLFWVTDEFEDGTWDLDGEFETWDLAVERAEALQARGYDVKIKSPYPELEEL